LDRERAAHWLSRGAQPSETVKSFLKKAPPVPAQAAPAPEKAPPAES
jgi:ribosomal protein S16